MDKDNEMEVIDLVEPTSRRCLNTSCKALNTEFIKAPVFCLSYFQIKKSKKYENEICMDCYDQSVQYYDKLATTVKTGGSLFSLELPIMDETFQIDDSDEEDDTTDDKQYIEESNLNFICDNLGDVLKEAMEKFDVKNLFEKEKTNLATRMTTLTDDCIKIAQDTKKIQKLLDRTQKNFYKTFHPQLTNVPGLTIVDDYSLSPVTQIRSDVQKVIVLPKKTVTPRLKPILPKQSNTPTMKTSLVSTNEKPVDLPRKTFVEVPKLTLSNIYYITRDSNPQQSSWIKARLQEFIVPNPSDGTKANIQYRLIELKQQKERLLDKKQMAALGPSDALLPVGKRVIAILESDVQNLPENRIPRRYYYAGIVAEQPVVSNKYRYLIFFDIGYAQYVHHTGVNLVIQASAQVWEDLPEGSKHFIKKYLESKDRPMVKLTVNQTVKVEYNGKWYWCSVKAIDCSLVRVYFDALKRWEWIYRGSTRLNPMYREELAASSRHGGVRTASRKFGNDSAPVQYTVINDNVISLVDDTSPRAVAKKSTNRSAEVQTTNIVPFLPNSSVDDDNSNKNSPTTKVVYFTPRDTRIINRKLRTHQCSPTCKNFITYSISKVRGYNPLSKPLLCGWARLIRKYWGKKSVQYKAPCGRLLRNMSEVHQYLRLTESEMTVDMFDFNPVMRCLAEFRVLCTPDPKDLSKGQENVVISVVNGINNDILDFCNYSTKRVPMGGVNINTDPEFLCGCDCTDDCQDKMKCSCWQLTLEGVKYLGKDPKSVGYVYKRLHEQVLTGIYECNSRCKCSSTCLNRVVQNSLSLKLQVFRTKERGWGIRCLNDVPQGTFICIYAGTIHTEHDTDQMAHEDGTHYGDEYLAELDYIETAERFKEDYEEEAIEDEPDKERSPSPMDVDDVKSNKTGATRKRNQIEDNEFVVRHFSPIQTPPTSEGIRSRLRKRNDDGKDDKDQAIRIKQEFHERRDPKEIRHTIDSLPGQFDTVTISDDEDEQREVLSFNPALNQDFSVKTKNFVSVRELYDKNEKDNVYIMDAKNAGNIGRFFNHSCSPNVFVQNVFIDTHDLRFPWVAFFSSRLIRAGNELTWNYNYDVGSVPNRTIQCLCGTAECKGRLL